VSLVHDQFFYEDALIQALEVEESEEEEDEVVIERPVDLMPGL
jgi:hypothetical protein